MGLGERAKRRVHHPPAFIFGDKNPFIWLEIGFDDWRRMITVLFYGTIIKSLLY